MTDWLPYVPALLLVAALLWVPGLVVQVLLRDVRPLFFLASPAYGLAVIGTAGVVLELLGTGLSLLTVGVFTLAVGAVAGVVGLLFRRARGPMGRTGPGAAAAAEDRTDLFGLAPVTVYRGAVVLGLLLGTALLVRRLLFVVQEPGRFSQRYDNIFHLNAVRYAVDTGSASSLTLGRMLDPEQDIAVYPAVWHALGALVHPLADENVMVANNVVLLVVAGLVWPAACLFLSRTLVGPSPVALVVTGVASAGFAVLPFSLLEFGPLFPNLLGLSAAPVALAYLAALLGLDTGSRGPDAVRTPGRLWFTGLCWLAVTGGVFLAHPNVFMLVLVALVPMGLTAWGRATHRAVTSRRALRAVLLVLVLAGTVAVWLYLWNTLTTDFVRFRHTTPAAAYGEGALYATNGREDIPWVLALLTVAGAAAALRRRRLRWLVVAHLLVLFLYVVAASAPRGEWREWAVGTWYQDSFRLGASLPVTAVPLIALGASAVARAVQRRAQDLVPAQRRSVRARQAVAGATAVALVAAAVPLTQMRTMRDTLLAANARYEWGNPDGVLTEDEYALLEALPRLTDPDDVILVNPWNGGALAYAVSGRDVTQYHIADPDEQLAEVIAGLPAEPPAQACALAETEDVDYVLDFGQQYLELDNPRTSQYRPIDRLGEQPEPNLDLVAAVGAAELWEVTAC